MMLVSTFSDRSALACIGLLLNVLLGGAVMWRYIPVHPGRRFYALLKWFERKLSRRKRSDEARRFRGLVMTVALVSVATVLSLLLSSFAESYKVVAVLEIALVAMLLPARSLIDDVLALRAAVEKTNIVQARSIISRLCQRNTTHLDLHATTRAGIEHLAERFTDTVFSPLCWFLLLGFPGLVIARVVDTLDIAWRHRTSLHASFGWAATRLADLMDWLPARLAGIGFALSAIFVPGAHPVAAILTMRRDAHKFASPHAGWPVASLAGALGVTLGGPRTMRGRVIDNGWVGSGSAKITAADLRRAVLLYAICLLLIILLLAMVFIR